MKYISYTQMSEQLADVLEILRNGEAVIISEQGKPDLILNAQSLDTKKSNTPIWKLKNSDLKEAAASAKEDAVACLVEAAKKRILQDGNDVRLKSRKSLSFSEARKKTQTKHASIIKALEDK